MLNKIRALFNPERYHGWGKKRSYFEGWYYKLISADEDHAIAIIPGIAMDTAGNQEAFIQILDGKKGAAKYIKFSANKFIPARDKFSVSIAGNLFEKDQIKLDMPEVKGSLKFSNLSPWPSSLLSPGIMGPYTFVPFMECYHGILSMDHTIEGQLELDGERIDFSGGRGYMEKDWGHSFPSAYFWMQSNHFKKSGISFKASVAKIPWMRSSFVGFIAGLYLNDEIIQFTTYNGTKLRKSYADSEKVELEMENKKYVLTVKAKREKATLLAAPIQGFMDGRISESMTSTISVLLTEKQNRRIVFEDIGYNAGLEVAGKIAEIIL